MNSSIQAAPESPHVKPSWKQAVRGNVLMMGLVSLFTDFSSELMNPLIPIFIAGLAGGKMAAFWVGITEGIAETTASILKIYAGRISDRLGRRKAIVMLGYGLSTIARPLTALAGAPWHVTGLKFFDRVGKGIRTSPRDALIADSVSQEFRGLAFSFHRAMDHLGAVLGPLTGIAVLYAFLGYTKWAGDSTSSSSVSAQEMHALRVLFVIAVIPGLIAMWWLVFKVREISPHGQEQNDVGQARKSVWQSLPGRFYGFVGIVTLFALGNSSDMFLLLYGYQAFGMTLVQIIALWILLHISKITFSIPGGILSDRLGRRVVIVAGWAVYAMVYLGMAFVHAPWLFWTLFIVYGFYYGMTEGAEKALVTDFVPSQYRGTAFGIYHGAIGLAALPASLLFGVFWLELGPQVAFGIGAALAGAAALLLVGLLAVKKKPA